VRTKTRPPNLPAKKATRGESFPEGQPRSNNPLSNGKVDGGSVGDDQNAERSSTNEKTVQSGRKVMTPETSQHHLRKGNCQCFRPVSVFEPLDLYGRYPQQGRR
jgi:hypothetical protein